jgi:hypothetical protein
MICDKCGEAVESVNCNSCGNVILRLGSYCYLCGSVIVAKVDDDEEQGDFSDRILCSDGTCIGVVNEEGICKVCGKPYTPEP